MGSKAALHPTAPFAALHPAVSGRVFARRRAAVFSAAAILLLLILTALCRPVYCRVNGLPRVLWGRPTATSALAAVGARPGDLHDVHGALLREQGGQPPVAFRQGAPLPPETPLGWRDQLTIKPGADAREPVRERVELLPQAEARGLRPAAVAGTQRLQVGLVSGQTAFETVRAVPTVPVTAPALSRKAVALTFDDGPWPTTTGQIIDILRKHDARATFFVLGAQARGRPQLIREEIAAGCEVAIHSWYHANLARSSAAAIIADMNRCQQTLTGIVGHRIPLMRPPYGALNARARAAIAQTGLRIVMWTADTNDWRRPGSEAIYSRIMGGARHGAIILCHDGGGARAQTVAAVSRAVPALQARGYELVTVSELLGLQPRPEGGALILADGRRLQVKPARPEVRLQIDGEAVALADELVEVDGQLMVPVRPVLDQLGLRWSFSQPAQKLTLVGPFERLVVRVNSLEVETGSSTTEELSAPPILYRGHLMVPLWLALRVGQASGLHDPATRTLRLISLERTMRETAEGRLAPAEWGKGVGWREYLGAR
jgi:peptidoglycan/xylan/chitin deacetylase (PgdA/CDA1 family)